jgi:WD40 repeat protein
MEAHESALRGLALTADGAKLATASVKGTVIRVFDVASASCLREFRRGVERATITCLAWSWDDAWLCCTSDKGTAHIFREADVDPQEGNHHQQQKTSSPSLSQMLYTTMRKSVEGDAKKSVCQVRGVPHPLACAFVAEATNLLAVAGWDADGNGVLLLSRFTPGQEPVRVGYHILSRSTVRDSSDEARRRRRLRGWTPEVPHTPEGGRLYIGERVEILEKSIMEQIQFDEKDDDEFVSVVTTISSVPAAAEGTVVSKAPAVPQHIDGLTDQESSSQTTEGARSNSQEVLGSTVGDSVRTEPLDDEEGGDASDHQ